MTNPTNVQDNPLTSFFDGDMLAQLHLERLSDEDRMQFLESFLFVVYMRVLQRIIDSISEKDQEELDQLRKKNPQDVKPMREYLLSRVPAFPQIEKEEVARYIKELVEDMQLKMQTV